MNSLSSHGRVNAMAPRLTAHYKHRREFSTEGSISAHPHRARAREAKRVDAAQACPKAARAIAKSRH